MSTMESGNNANLETRAKSQDIDVPEVQNCWSILVEGIRYHMLNTLDLDELIDILEKGCDYGSEEIFFEFIGGQLRVRLFEEVEFCPPDQFIEQLKKLQKRT